MRERGKEFVIGVNEWWKEILMAGSVSEGVNRKVKEVRMKNKGWLREWLQERYTEETDAMIAQGEGRGKGW